VPRFLARDLPVRRKQARVGIATAQAQVARAEWETLYGVTFSYLTALYARQQMQVADQARKDLRELQDLAQGAVTAGARDVTTRHVERVGIYLRIAAGRREEAVEGVQRAFGALREAMGVAPDYPIQLAAQEMPWVSTAVDRDQVIALALAQRGELVQAANAAQVTDLEVSAQEAKRLPSQRTFASGSDLHAQPVPTGSYDDNYRPAPTAPGRGPWSRRPAT
jgi:outer membrane protein TolC